MMRCLVYPAVILCTVNNKTSASVNTNNDRYANLLESGRGEQYLMEREAIRDQVRSLEVV